MQSKVEINFEFTKEDIKLIKKALLVFYYNLVENRSEIGERERVKYIERIEVLEQELSLIDKF